MSRATTLLKGLLIGLLVLFSSSPTSIAAAADVPTSTGPEGGSVYALAIDPVTPTATPATTPRPSIYLPLILH